MLRRSVTPDALANVIREVISSCRVDIARGADVLPVEEIADLVVRRVRSLVSLPLPVINATGVILHTNLGRSPLSLEALAAIAAVSGYSDLEYNLSSGGRGSRQERVIALLTSLTAAEYGHVVVNNASAVTLALAALARRREVIVSRGQAVEIGGGFRVPVILRQSGARLVEVGTTNRTRIEDYEAAITARTGALLHVHASNFRIVGFSQEVSIADLAGLAARHGLPLIVDNGSGSLVDTRRFGLRHEPTPQDALEAGAGLVAFSADKLLGGPQAGILLGRRDLVERAAAHPLARAFRPDKVILAALAATLIAYVRGDAIETLPLWRMIAQTPQQIEQRAAVWQERAAGRGISVELVPGASTIGGGSLPGETLPTTLVALPAAVTAASLRLGAPPVIARSAARGVQLDLRTVPSELEERLLDAVSAALPGGGTP